MDVEAFARSPSRLGTAMRTDWGMKGESEYEFYIPTPLPRELDLSEDTLDALSTADRHVGALYYLDRIMPNPHLLIRPYIRKEAVLSSKIEGTQASLSDVLMEEADTPDEGRPGDVHEVINYILALEQGLNAIEKGPLDLNLLKRLHGTLMKDVRGHDPTPGAFRDYQNWIGPEGCAINDAVYVPPAPEAMNGCLNELDSYLQRPPKTPALIQAGLLHYQFEAIHPFGDGNGRIGRLLIILFLMQREILSAPLLYLSAYFEKHRSKYYELLLRTSTEGQYEDWLRFFLEGVKIQSREAADKASQLADLHKKYRDKLGEVKATPGAFALIDGLFDNPYITIPHAVDALNVSYPTAQRAIENHLVKAGILKEVTGRRRNRLFVAQEILDLFD